MSIKKISGRQEVVAAHVPFSYEDIESGTAEMAIELPNGAIVVDGFLAITEAFDSATTDTADLGNKDAGDRYVDGADIAAVGVTAFTVDGVAHNVDTPITLTWTGTGAAPTAGKGNIVVRYIVEGRAAFTQGRDSRPPLPVNPNQAGA